MEGTPPLTTAADLELRAARVADPGIDLKTKHNVACELRELIDVVRESELARVIPHMVPVLLDILRSGEAAYHKDGLEYLFRRCLIDILHRIPSQEAVRPHALTLFHGMLYLLRHDNEENGMICCKIIIDIVRSYRSMNEELVSELTAVIQEVLQGTEGLVQETLSENSAPMDPNIALPARRSFKVLMEVATIIVPLLQSNRALALPALQKILPLNFVILSLESPAQKQDRENHEAMGNILVGMSSAIKNPSAFSDFIVAQIKMISYLAFVLRSLGEHPDSDGEKLIRNVVRLLQDCPPTAVGARKDLLVVLRHVANLPQRRALVHYIDKLTDERVLLGTGLGCREAIRQHAMTCFYELLQHIRHDMSAAQLTRVCHVHLRYLHDPRLALQLQLLSAKTVFSLLEAIVTKDTQQGAARTLRTTLDAFVDKLDSMADIQADVSARVDKIKNEEKEVLDFSLIEKARPIGAATYALEKPDDIFNDYRPVVPTLVQGVRALLIALKKCDASIPDGTIISRLFESAVRCITLLNGDQRIAVEAMELLANTLIEVNLHVFQEVWTQKIGFFVECAEKRPVLMNLAHSLFTREVSSPTLVAIVLRFLVNRLPQLGDYDDQNAAVAIRMFKMAFTAVAVHPQVNEPLLAAHLGKLIMDCFPLAAKAKKPINYFHLLRLLFRAIGGGGGRFELLYKEVLPLLPEMLDCLNRQLIASDGLIRDMIVELCLTVPLRLTHLLPYLSYLMQPLVLALRGNPELVSQGLRTLELCIDNLTPDFLDPTLNTVLRDLMEALHSHLKPIPANHQHAHTTIRILGKLGGRNRRLLDKEPALKYRDYSELAKTRVSFGGVIQSIELAPTSILAATIISTGKGGSSYRTNAYEYLETCLNLLLHEGVRGRDREEVFLRCLEGSFDALHLPELQERAEKNIQAISRSILSSEVRRATSKDVVTRRLPSKVLICYLDGLAYGLSRENPTEAAKVLELARTFLQELVGMADALDITPQDIIPTLTQIASRFNALCLEDSWVRRTAGCNSVGIMTQISGLGVKWVADREVDLVKVLLVFLKDMPYDLPRDVDRVVDVIMRIIRVSNQDLASVSDDVLFGRSKMVHLIGTLFAELASSSAIVRRAAQQCLQLLADLANKTPAELLRPYRERMLSNLYTKPLRALPFSIQIGIVEALRYCISLNPPLPELNEELMRLLHETLALADADDMALIGRSNPRQSSLEIVKLRVACIKLLTASMPLTDFFVKQLQTRQKVTSVYFKSLYSPNQEVKDVAHEGLRMVLTHQNRLPRELLQSGLRPILMNLADPKRLSIPGLEGLAKLLELLTNYFKVEIGHKLLDHFRVVADPQMLQASSRLPLLENEGITKLVRLANIFHLLPSAANIFLENLVNAIVQTEAQMHFSAQSPFSEPLAKYLDRYPIDAVDFFMRHLHFPRHVRTLRSILQAKLASNLLRELASRTMTIVTQCFEGSNASLVLPGLLICSDLANLIPGWLAENPRVVDALLDLWTIEPSAVDSSSLPLGDIPHRYLLMASIFMKALQQTPRIDLLFTIIAIFSRDLPVDMVHIAQFLYRHVAFNDNLPFRRNILLRFFMWFRHTSVPWSHKTHFLQFIFTPTILIHSSQSDTKLGLLDEYIVKQIHSYIWQPMIDDVAFSQADDMFKVELLHMTTVMVHRYPELLQEAKKDIIRCAWHYITSDDTIVKQTAYLLAARFFEAFEGPQKFHLRVWTGLLKPPHVEGRAIYRQALDIIAPVLLRSQSMDSGFPQWAKTTRRLLAEEGTGWHQVALIYQLIVRQASLFFPVRALFVPHIVNYIPKLGLSNNATHESRSLSIDILQVIFDWEQKATSPQLGDTTLEVSATDETSPGSPWVTPLPFRESIVSYLVRLSTLPQDAQSRGSQIASRALSLLRLIVSPTGWNEVTFKLHFFSRTLEQNDFKADAAALNQAQSSAKVLQVISADKSDLWFSANSAILTKLVKKGIIGDDPTLQDALLPVLDRLVRLYPLPKEDEDQQSEASDFHAFIYSSIGENLRNADELRTNATGVLRGSLLILKSVVQVSPERIDPFSAQFMKLLSRLAKDHIQSSPSTSGFEENVRLITLMLEISQTAVGYLGEQRKWLLSALMALVEKSKSGSLCRYMLDIARDWAMNKRDPYPTMKEKAGLLQKMASFEMRGERGEPLFNSYLELIYDIYTDPSLRRTDLTTRLEQPFLLGCRATDSTIRERFMDLMDVSIPRSLFSRLIYVFGVQSWEALADHNWLFLALYLLLGSVDTECAYMPDRKGSLETSLVTPPLELGLMRSMIQPMQRLLFLDSQIAHDVWVAVFPAAWACLSRREQIEITHHIIALLSKDYHIKQAEMRPNVIQTLLSGIQACSPPISLPPHLVKYLAKTFGAWYVAAEILNTSLLHVREDEALVRDTIYDSLAELYAELAEDDIFYGLWRRRSLYAETNVGIAFEQCGMWEQASSTYEIAQSRTRAGNLPFSEAEFCLWEDHWMLSAEKLQQWDLLYDVARGEGNQELVLESAWRTKDWSETSHQGGLEEQISQLAEVATPRRRIFEAFMALLKNQNSEFTRILEDAMQLSLRKWVSLPSNLTSAHIPLLQHFQQFVELQEAVQIFGSLSATNAQNLEKRSSDLKMVLQAWRERLPNICDDISVWSDLVAWRQNVFNAINKAYIPLIAASGQGGTASSSSPTFGYRGYHETAWIINRFAHVARKHDLLDVCFNSLNKIYTLPNIEISEAFLKLREQARCHYQKPGDLQAGLEVINNTNLIYFSISQKAEFYTLKGMFHAKFGRNDEASHAFGQAVQLDMLQAKAWAAWGRYSDQMFKEFPNDVSHAANAVSCYLQAAGLYKNQKCRPLLTRILWLLSVDDGNFTVSRAFDTYKGDAAFWYWIALIPQLCLSMSNREMRQARSILLNLAKLYPQALFFNLRSTREEMALAKRQAAATQRATNSGQPLGSASQGISLDILKKSDSDHLPQDSVTENNADIKLDPVPTENTLQAGMAAAPRPLNGNGQAATRPSVLGTDTNPSHPARQAWEGVDEVVQILKTAFPLLILSMESMVEQIGSKFKASSEEEVYRLVCVLLQEAVQQFAARVGSEDDGPLPPQTSSNLSRLAQNMLGSTRKEYEEDFLKEKLSLNEYIKRLQQWRDKHERFLDARPRFQTLDLLSHSLMEFQYGRFDDIEVPGQYTEDKDSNQNFARISKFGSKLENCRSHGYCWRRFTIHGHDHSKTSFAVQLPSGRHCRREERVMQLFRTFNLTLYRKKESRKRSLQFHLPVAVPCGTNLRILQNDSSYVSFGDIYDQHCENIGVTRDHPSLVLHEKLKIARREFEQTMGRKVERMEASALRKDMLDDVITKMVPEDTITRYMIRTMSSPSDLWHTRKQFALQIAATSFMTYVLCISSRVPGRFHWSRTTGQIAMTFVSQSPIFGTTDTVPFRLTPNMQHFMGPILIEGVLTSAMMALGRCLTEPEFNLEQQLCLFVRDEVFAWQHRPQKAWNVEISVRKNVAVTTESIVKRAETIACQFEREQAISNPQNLGSTPVLHTVTKLISEATSPMNLIKMPEAYLPWF
ncbi:uncharacterized protein FIBRA_03647 [Fibroporia radiculosa]|uniref:Non-specific serine/threonine protein kinase n=1 Tax=Fibroporia radiculosa TaxID=599839 RepID=J4HW38_9APHY|nr:uncharacterized protein FIBRA_03647 [Fibroporia radiculosa]CCM01587.1 predicted protein [Fibroporia radiculosa]